jgi:hypothetical protein
MNVLKISEVVRRLRKLPPGEIVLVFPPSELARAREIGADGHIVFVVPQPVWDRCPAVKPGNRVLITDCQHLLTLFKE